MIQSKCENSSTEHYVFFRTPHAVLFALFEMCDEAYVLSSYSLHMEVHTCIHTFVSYIFIFITYIYTYNPK